VGWALACLAGALGAAEVVKKDGEVLSGAIEDLRLDEYIRIRTADKRLFEVEWKDLAKLNGKPVEAAAPLGMPEPITVTPALEAPHRKFYEKGWYLDLLELGIAVPQLPGSVRDRFEQAAALPRASRIDMGMGMLGLYFPVGSQHKALLGVMASAQATGVSQDGYRWSFVQDIFGVSGHYYPAGKIGDGFFLRGDLGWAEAVFSSSALGGPEETLEGTGFKVGAGYAFPAGDWVSPMIALDLLVTNFDHSTPNLPAGIYQSFNLNAGLLF
jgi:hypothetical protein